MSFRDIAALTYYAAKINREIQKINKVKVPHLIYEQIEWAARSCKPQPYIKLDVRVDTKAYRDQNIRPPSAYKHRAAEMSMLADTGCQATVMGSKQLSQLGLSVGDLMAVEFKMSAANSSSIKLLGALFIVISGRDASGQLYETHQLAYVGDGISGMLLSKEALEKLGMLPDTFPAVGCAAQGGVAAQSSELMSPDLTSEQYDLTPCNPKEDGTCECPRREAAPDNFPEFDPTLSTEELRMVIIKHYASSAFNRCTRQKLPLMKGEPLPIPVRPDVKPTAVHTPIPVPLHWEDKVKRDLERDVALGVIEPVPINSPVTWCSRMITVPKHNGEPRRVVDLQALNRASVRQTHHTKSPFMLASAVPANKVKSVLDIWNSFHSVPIREEDRDKTCFICPMGRFRYKVAPQGYLASYDGYTHRFDLITAGIQDKVVIVDDSLLWSDDIKSNFYDVCNLVKTCHDAGLIFNADKFQFGQDTVDFAGLEVTNDGVRPSGKFLDAIRAFPRPDTLSAARSFFGMINQVTYAFSMSTVMEEFRHLLKPDTWASGFKWTKEMEEKFILAKEKIVETVVEGVKHFDTDRWTCLATDWSKEGIGFFLLQKYCSCEEITPNCCNDGWKLVLAGGRFTKPSESRYSPVEGECLAVVDALQKARHFLLGCKRLVIAVDHKPLLGILNDKPLADIQNPRLLMLKEKTLWYNFKVVHVPGERNCGPDYMSRLGMTKKEARVNLMLGFAAATKAENDDEGDVTINEANIIDGVVKSLSSSDVIKAVTFDEVKIEVRRDQEMLDLITAIQSKEEMDTFPDQISVYNKYREDLLVVDGVPMYGRRIIIPKSLRSRILDGLHSAHQCSVKMTDRAKDSVFWPGITADIENKRKMCVFCERNAPSQAMMPPLPLESPQYPFQMVVGDFFNVKGKSWLVLADRFSGWLSVHYYPREASTTELIRSMKDYFSVFGICEHFSSDDGPQFRSTEFRNFLQSWGVSQHRVSAAYHPHSNLRAEAAVKSSKRIVMDNTRSDGSPRHDALSRAIMQHRNTPDSEFKLSPAQLVFGRPIRDFLPIKPGHFSPSEVWIDSREKRELALRDRVTRGAERWSEHTKNLKPLSVGEKVMIQNQHGAGKLSKKWDRSGLVVEDLGFHKYRVRVDGSGRVTDRNRRFLRKYSTVSPILPGPCPIECLPQNTTSTPVTIPSIPNEDIPSIPNEDIQQEPVEEIIEPEPENSEFTTPPSSPVIEISHPRRSSRVSKQPERLNIKDTNSKSYDIPNDD